MGRNNGFNSIQDHARQIGFYILTLYIKRKRETGCGEMELTVKIYESNGQMKFDINPVEDVHAS